MTCNQIVKKKTKQLNKHYFPPYFAAVQHLLNAILLKCYTVKVKYIYINLQDRMNLIA